MGVLVFGSRLGSVDEDVCDDEREKDMVESGWKCSTVVGRKRERDSRIARYSLNPCHVTQRRVI